MSDTIPISNPTGIRDSGLNVRSLWDANCPLHTTQMILRLAPAKPILAGGVMRQLHEMLYGISRYRHKRTTLPPINIALQCGVKKSRQ